MSSRDVYLKAMRVYRLARNSAINDIGARNTAEILGAATSLVRTLTGKFDLPRPPRQFIFSGRKQSRPVMDAEFAVLPRFTERNGHYVCYRPGKLHVMRSMTEFCRRTSQARRV